MDFPVAGKWRLRPGVVQEAICREGIFRQWSDGARIIWWSLRTLTILPSAALAAPFLAFEECFATTEAVTADRLAAAISRVDLATASIVRSRTIDGKSRDSCIVLHVERDRERGG